jgi:hypothetical protein
MEALVQRCFTMPRAGHSKPGVPATLDVSSMPFTGPNRHLHDIAFDRKTDAEGKPKALYLTRSSPRL